MTISDFGFRISDLHRNHPECARCDGEKFKIQNSKFKILLVIALLVIASACAHRGSQQVTAPRSSTPQTSQPAPTPSTESVEKGWTEKGVASWYGDPYHGRQTASGEIYDMYEMTAAHKTLAFGSVVKVNRRDTGADVTVRINDRGPFIEGRIIDLSFAAAKKIDLDVDGVAPVKIKVVGRQEAPRRAQAKVPEDEECFWVQVGAFSERGRAERAEAELESAGEEAMVLEGLDDLWRVRLGPFEEEKNAERVRNRVTNAWPGAHVTPCGG